MAQPIEIGELLAPDKAHPRVWGGSTSILRSGRLAEILLQILTAFLLLNSLTAFSVAGGSEARTAAVASEMLQSRRFWFPTLNGAVVLDAPPLGYLIQMVFFTIFGRSELAVRLPSILFGVLQILCVRGWARRADGRSARRFAQLALLFTPGWLEMTRQGGPEPAALALILVGLAMATRGTTLLAAPGHDSLRAVRWATPWGWFGAGILWGLAALMLGPICLWVILPASAVAIFALPPKSASSPILRWLLGPILAAAAMFIVYAVWPISLSIAGHDPRAAFYLNPSHPVEDLGAFVKRIAIEYPVTIVFSVTGALIILIGGLVQRIPDILGWFLFLLAFFVVQPGVGDFILYAAAAPLAILVGVGLYDIVRRLVDRDRTAGAIALWLLAAVAVGIEFSRHFEWNPQDHVPVRSVAHQILPYLRAHESLAVVGLPAESLAFYVNENQEKMHLVHQMSEAEWRAMQKGEGAELLRDLRFLVAPVEFMQQPENFPKADWRIAGKSAELVLLEYVRPSA